MSLTHAPLAPCCLNFLSWPSRLIRWLEPMKAKRLPSMKLAGIGWPLSSLSLGLCSKNSSWLGPPAMKR